MAQDDKGPAAGSDNTQAPETRLQEVLADRWDPGKMSRFMRSSASKSQRLDLSQRNRFEGRYGVNLGDVRIFSGELAEEITHAHGAEALTVGDTGMILMRQSSAFAPGSAAGTALLAHELAHVAQARPTALSFKKTSRLLAEEDESEEEAEEHEEEVLAEELGLAPPAAEEPAKKDAGDRARKEKIFEAVRKMFEEDVFLMNLRLGARADSK